MFFVPFQIADCCPPPMLPTYLLSRKKQNKGVNHEHLSKFLRILSHPLTVTYISNIQIGLYVPNWFTMHNILSRMFTLYIKVVA